MSTNQDMVVLTLTNFRCFDYFQLKLSPNDNFILLSAPSGSGKTSILLAFKYAVYGTGTKIVKYDKTSCKVELQMNGLHIVREKKPNRLVLTTSEGVFEDSVAQSIINMKFNESIDFTEFIDKTPSEKLNFLEKLVFKDVNIIDIKDKCKNLKDKYQSSLDQVVTQLQMSNTVLEDLKKPVVVEYPFKSIYKKNEYTILKDNEQKKIKDYDEQLKKLKSLLMTKNNELTDLKIFNSFMKSNNDNIEKLNRKLEELEYSKDIVYNGDEYLAKHDKKLKIVIKNRKYMSLENKYNEYIVKHENIIAKETEKDRIEIEKIDSTLWTDYTVEEANDIITFNNTYLKNLQKIAYLRTQIVNYNGEDVDVMKNKLDEYREMHSEKNDELENLKKSGITYKCPGCNIDVCFYEGDLHRYIVVGDNIERNINDIGDELKSISKKIKLLEKNIPSVEHKLDNNKKIQKEIDEIEIVIKNYNEEDNDTKTILSNIEFIEEYVKKQKNDEARKKLLQTRIINSNLEDDIDDLVDQLNEIDINDEDDCDIDETNEDVLRDIVFKERKARNDAKTYNDNKISFENDIKELYVKQKYITKDHIDKYLLVNELSDISNIIDNITDEINVTETNYKESSILLKNSALYDQYIKDIEYYRTWEDKCQKLMSSQNIAQIELSSALTLNTKVREAENIVLLNIVERLNDYAKVYLDEFFDNSMTAILTTFKEVGIKSTIKPTISMNIVYNSHVCDLSSLSCGERARLNMAFVMAFNEIYKTPLLMLDEQTSNLDAENTMKVFDFVKEVYNGKILVVAHQVVLGIFDRVIEL